MTGPCGSGDMAEIWKVKCHPGRERERGTSMEEESWGHEGQKRRFDLDPEARKTWLGSGIKNYHFSPRCMKFSVGTESVPTS